MLERGIFRNLKPADYHIYIKDTNGCTTLTNIITVGGPSLIMATYTKTYPTCNGSNNGTITATATGGTPPFKYKLGNGLTYQNSGTFNGLQPGNYRVYVLDVAGCIGVTDVITINQSGNVCNIIAKANRQNESINNSSLKLTLSPNPSNDKFALLVQSNSSSPLQLKVTDINGKIVYQNKSTTEHAFSFGESFINGVYIVEVRKGDEIKIMKAVKLK